MAYDLPKTPRGHRAELAIIVAPYFDLWFACRIIEHLKPRRIRFVVDDGARDEDIRDLIKACGAGDVKVALGRAAGIVHLKAYYVEFLKPKAAGACKRLFIFGSANATEAAFGGSVNAELFAEAKLSSTADAELIRYLKSISDAVEGGRGGAIAATTARASRNVPALFLPAFEVRVVGPPPGLDAWLQRGRLAAKYRDAQQFMAVAVTLKKALPPGTIAEQFQTQGLIQQGAHNVVRYRYVPQAASSDENGDESVPQWKARFCVWTHLGDWLSEECYEQKHELMVSNAKPAREAAISDLLKHRQDHAWKSERKQLFLRAIEGVWQALLSTNVSPHEYLRGGARGIDQSHYGALFDRKLSADLVLAQDSSFYRRYINGYEFPDVPRFRQDALAWQEFVRSFCESVAVEAGKRSTRSLITRVIRKAVQPADLSEMSPDQIRDTLRASWNGDKVGNRVDARYSDGDYYPGRITAIVTKLDRSYFKIKYDDGDVGQVGTDGIRSVRYYMTRYLEWDDL